MFDVALLFLYMNVEIEVEVICLVVESSMSWNLCAFIARIGDPMLICPTKSLITIASSNELKS
jgi:hypothetical protein